MTPDEKRIYDDNAEIGAAALRRVEALEKALRGLVDADSLDAIKHAKESARDLLKADWMPECVRVGGRS